MNQLRFAIMLLAGCAGDPLATQPPGPTARHFRPHEPRVLARDQPGANDIAVDGERVYWTNFTDDGALMAVPLGGGPASPLALNLARPGRLCLDADYVYWTSYTDGTVNRTPLAGGPTVTLATGQTGPAACARYGDRLVWTNFVESGSIVSIDLVPNAMPVTLAENQLNPNVVVLRDDEIYWVRSHETEGAVVRMNAAGQSTELASQQPNPFDIAVDDHHVYWTNRTGGTVRRVPISGGAVDTLATQQDQPLGIALDRDFVYWTNFGGGTVMKAPIVGGEPTVLANGQGGPRRIAVDDTSIYWTNYEAGAVMAMPKR